MELPNLSVRARYETASDPVRQEILETLFRCVARMHV